MNRTLLQDFVLKYLETVGRPAGETEPGVFAMSPAGGAPVELTFDPEAAAEKPERELVTFGSPFLEAALAQTLCAGRVLHLHALARPVDPALVDQRLRTRLTFDRVRFSGLEPGRMVEGRIFKIHFVVSIHGDVVQQVACPVWIDGSTGRPADPYRAEAGRLSLEDARQFVLPLDTEAGPERITAAMLTELERHTTARLLTLETELAHQHREEERRVLAYFRQREEETEAKRDRARSEDTASKAAQTLAAIHAERDMRLRETELRYRPRVEARIAAVEVLHVQRLVTAMLVQKGSETFRIPVRYEAALGSVGLPDCPACGEPAEILIGQRDVEKPGCGRCLHRPEPAPSTEARSEQDVAKPAHPPAASVPAPVRPRATVTIDPPKRSPREEFSRLKVSPDFWLVVARTASRTSTNDFQRRRHLSDHTARELLAAFDKGFGESPLQARPGAPGKGVTHGRGLATFLAEGLLLPTQLFSHYVEFLSDAAQDRALEGKTTVDHRFLRGFGEPPATSIVAQAHGIGHHVRVLLGFRIGASEPLARSAVATVELLERVVSILRRELGLTSRGDDLWLLLKTTHLRDCAAGARRCLELLQGLVPGSRPDPDPAVLRRQLQDAARPGPSAKGR